MNSEEIKRIRVLIERWFEVAATGSANGMQDFVAGLSEGDAKAVLWTLAWQVDRKKF